MPTQFEGDKIRESVVINQSIDDKNNPSGYAADSEDETENTLYKSHDCRSGKTKSYGQFVSSPSKKRRKESMVFPIEDTTWIQRLYRGTPFSRTSIARKTAQDDFSFMPREPVDDQAFDSGIARFGSPSYKSIGNNRFVSQRQRLPYMVNGRQSILPFDHQDPFEEPSSSDSSSGASLYFADPDSFAKRVPDTHLIPPHFPWKICWDYSEDCTSRFWSTCILPNGRCDCISIR